MPAIYSLPYYPLRVTSPYGYRSINIPGATSWHAGIDLGADKSKYSGSDGGPVLAVADGVIQNSYFNTSRGWVVIIDHGAGFLTLYQHLLRKGLSAGVKVRAGQEIGRMGATGAGAGVHLHFETIINGKREDPLPHLLNISKGDQGMEKVYKTMAEVPKWYRSAAEDMIQLGGITPGADGSINLSEDMARVYTSFDKIGLLGAIKALRTPERG